MKFNSNICGHQARHKAIVHEEVKYSCRNCNQQFPWKSSVAKHQGEVHEGFKSTTKNNENKVKENKKEE